MPENSSKKDLRRTVTEVIPNSTLLIQDLASPDLIIYINEPIEISDEYDDDIDD